MQVIQPEIGLKAICMNYTTYFKNCVTIFIVLNLSLH